MKVLDLFSGIGGFSLGLERAGFETVAFCEIEPYPRKVLAKHWPKVPIYDDVRRLTAKRLADDGLCPEVITAGFPCQDVSIAGKQAGIGEGTRSGLWSEIARLIGELRPKYTILENVTALLSGDSGRWFGRILGDLAEVGYDAEWHCIPASAVGAIQRRDRVWIIAYPTEKRAARLITSEHISQARQGREGGPQNLQYVAELAREPGSGRINALFRRVDDRPAHWVDRVGACGNAVVPQIPELIGRAIMEYERTCRQKRHVAK